MRVVRVLLASAILCCSLRAAGKEAPTIVICSSDGHCESHGATDSLQVPEGAAFAWIWTSKDLPRRLTAKEITATISSSLESDRASSVRIQTSPVMKDERLTVITAPAAMWKEVPEPLLPRIAGTETMSLPVGHVEPWRVRITSAVRTSPWTDVEKGPMQVPLVAREPRELIVLDSDGERLANAHVSVLSAGSGAQRSELIARFATDRLGRFVLPDAAGLLRVGIIVSHSEHAPRWLLGNVEDLPSPIRLEPGFMLTGRVVRREEEDLVPVANARVSVDAWIGESTAGFAKNVLTSGDGTFRIESVPRGRVLIAVARATFAVWRESFELAGHREFEMVLLQPEARTSIRIVDAEGVGIERASVKYGGEVIRADTGGRIPLRGLSPDRPTKLVASAPGFVLEEVVLTPPLEEEMVIALRRGVTIRGTCVTEEGLAPVDGMVTARVGAADRTRALQEDGSFELTVPPDEPVDLSVSSTSGLDVNRTVEPAAPGVLVDLGRIMLLAGNVARGRVVSAADFTPISPASIWAVKPSKDGAVVAFVRGKMLRTTSASDGTFELRGLDGGPVLLRVDAPGFARLYREATPDRTQRLADLGDLVLHPGSLVTVLADDGGECSAELDLRGNAFPGDLLTVPVIGGKAEFRHVAGGSYRVRIRKGQHIDCETQIHIRPGEDAKIECAAAQMRVRGRVFIGHRPARRGSLIWTSRDGEGVHGIIINRDSPGGLRQQQAFGGPSASVTVPVADDGVFTSNVLRPGLWNVLFIDEDRNSISSIAIDVPPKEEFDCTIRYQGGLVTGIVRDRDGRPHAGATVTDVRNRARTRSKNDGSFVLMGIAAGTARLMATSGELRSEIVEVPISDDASPAAELRLGAENVADTRIAVQTRHGVPAAGAFVFIETPSRQAAILTADQDGVATWRRDGGDAQPIRLAAFAGGEWFLGEWVRREEIRDSMSIRITNGGSMTIRGAGDVLLRSHSGWDVTGMLRFLGMPAFPDSGTVTISGLPTGAYLVEADGRSLNVAVSAERATNIDVRP